MKHFFAYSILLLYASICTTPIFAQKFDKLDFVTAAINWNEHTAFIFGFNNKRTQQMYHPYSLRLQQAAPSSFFPLPIELSGKYTLNDGYQGYWRQIPRIDIDLETTSSIYPSTNEIIRQWGNSKLWSTASQGWGYAPGWGGNKSVIWMPILTNIPLQEITAALNWDTSIAYLFGYTNDDADTLKYARYNKYQNTIEQVHNVNNTWIGINLTRITAAVHWGNNKIYFLGFMANNPQQYYVRYDTISKTVDAGYPRPINERTWFNMPLHSISAAMRINDNTIVLFGNYNGDPRQYFILYNIERNKAIGKPQILSAQSWPGLF